MTLQNARGEAGGALSVGRNGPAGTRPDRNGREFHPGLIGLPGSNSVVAAFCGPARETNPNSLPGTLPNSNLGCVARRGDAFLDNRETRPGARSTQRWGLLIDGTGFASRVSQLRNFSTSRGLLPGSDENSSRDGSKSFHVFEHGERRVPKPRKVFTFAGKEDERRN